MTPAAPNTYVVEKEANASDGYTKEPVIGYVYEPGKDQPPMVVTLQGQRRLVSGGAVLFPCGVVADPLNGHTFATAEEWLEFNPKQGGARGKATTESKAAKPEPEDDEAEEGYDIEWTNKSFKNNSFWHYDDGKYEFCFILPGEEDAPKASEKLAKIKRTEMDALKKNIDVLDIEDVKNPDILPDGDDDSGDDDDDDEDDGLI